jgi:uncharacterized protein involved in type VI secretion and phage assembly
MRQFFGKYRAIVTNNIDPQQSGRILVELPAITNFLPSTWAIPCLPFTGTQSGFFVVPAIGSGVWIEFEQGDVGKPIWTGGYFGSPQELPPLALASPPGTQTIVVQTTQGNLLMISDTPGPTGGILLKTSTGASIAVNDVAITIDNGKGASISLTANTVSVNQGALEVI